MKAYFEYMYQSKFVMIFTFIFRIGEILRSQPEISLFEVLPSKSLSALCSLNHHSEKQKQNQGEPKKEGS